VATVQVRALAVVLPCLYRLMGLCSILQSMLCMATVQVRALAVVLPCCIAFSVLCCRIVAGSLQDHAEYVVYG
jgi:hypothetical protein